MKNERQSGFVLILVITLLAVIGIELFVLSGNSNILLFQSNTAYLCSIERNMTSSAIAWARKNIKDKGTDMLGKTVQLDFPVKNLNNSSLNITFVRQVGSIIEIKVDTLCGCGRRILKNTFTYYIESDLH